MYKPRTDMPQTFAQRSPHIFNSYFILAALRLAQLTKRTIDNWLECKCTLGQLSVVNCQLYCR